MKNPLSKVERLKRQARTAYRAYLSAGGDLDCGLGLAEYIRPEIAEYRRQFNAIMDELKTLDPTCPLQKL